MRWMLMLCCLLATRAHSQDIIKSEMPGYVQSSNVLEWKRFQAEGGYFRKGDANDLVEKFPELTFRYGFKTLELRLNTVREIFNHGGRVRAEGFYPLEPGIKVLMGHILDSAVSFAFQGSLGIWFLGSQDYDPQRPYYRAIFIMQARPTRFWNVNVNIGRDWDYFDQLPNSVYGMSFEFDVTKRLKTKLEFFGHVVEAYTSQTLLFTNDFRGGISYSLGKSLAVDVSGSVPVSRITGGNSFGVGLSWRSK